MTLSLDLCRMRFKLCWSCCVFACGSLVSSEEEICKSDAIRLDSFFFFCELLLAARSRLGTGLFLTGEPLSRFPPPGGSWQSLQ